MSVLENQFNGFVSILRPKDNVKRLNLFSKICMTVSILFWIRAIRNTRAMSKGYDLGVISFAGSTLSSFYLYLKTRGGVENFSAPTRLTRIIVLITHFIVVLNYAFGIYVAFNLGKVVYVKFAVYCISCTILWLFIAICGWKLQRNTTDTDVESFDKDELDTLYGFKSTTSIYSDTPLYAGSQGLTRPYYSS